MSDAATSTEDPQRLAATPTTTSTAKAPSKARGRVEWVIVVAGAVLVAVLLRAFVVQAFSIPSESMEPTLLVGDRVLVEKLTYHHRDVERGDVIVFLNPDRNVPVPAGQPAPPEHLIKRAIALGGDSVVLDNGQVWVNGVLSPDAAYIMPGSHSYELNTKYRCAKTDPCVIPPGHVWAMGDNREHSGDSRAFGPIPTDDIVGRAFNVVWPFNRFSGL